MIPQRRACRPKGRRYTTRDKGLMERSPYSDMTMESCLNTAIEVAREAGGLLLQHFRQPLEITYKRRSDLVTEADRRSETLIVERLRSHFPDHAIVAEEGGGQETGSDYCWYVDPLDGTTNFAHGFPVFSVTLGVAYRGEVVAGVVYDPTRDELFTAERGAGAFLNSQRLRVSNNGDLAECLVATGFPPFATNHDLNVEFISVSLSLRTVFGAPAQRLWISALWRLAASMGFGS